MKSTNYFTIQYWMVHDLRLRGVDRDVYAVIYGFTQDEESEFKGSISYISELTGHTRKSIIESIKYLEEHGLIYKLQSNSNIDKRNSYKCDFDVIDDVFSGVERTPDGVERTPDGVERTPSIVSREHYDGVEGTPHNYSIIENKKENNIESTGAGALEISSEINNPRRNFRKEHEVLKDDLQSGKDIDSEKQKKKKSPAERTRDNCLDEINKRNYSEDTKELLREYYLWASSGTDVRKIKSFNLWCSKLDYLEQLIKQGEDARSVVQQSIDKQWYKFEGVNKSSNNSQTSFEPLADKVIVTDEETRDREWAKKLESDEGWY